MKKYELGLAKGYVSDWTVQDALREFTQNGIDQETSLPGNAFSTEYDASTQTLRFCNKKSVLSKSTLLLGHSTKQDDDDAIGKFGEGYKLAVLVLLRHGCDVTIENYGAKELWHFRFSRMRKYENVESLVVDIKTQHVWDKTPNNDLSIVVSGITENDMKEYKNRIVGDLTVDEYIDTSYGRILLGKDYKGKIYVNGLYVTTSEEFEYGYDVKPAYLVIGRDRNLVNSFDISAVSHHMWLEADREDLIYDMLVNAAKDVDHFRYSWNTLSTAQSGLASSCLPKEELLCQKKLADSTWKGLCKEYEDKVVLVSYTRDQLVAQKKYRGKTIAVVPSSVGSLIEQYSDEYKEFMDEAERETEEREHTLEDDIWLWCDSISLGEHEAKQLFAILEKHGVVELEEELAA